MHASQTVAFAIVKAQAMLAACLAYHAEPERSGAWLALGDAECEYACCDAAAFVAADASTLLGQRVNAYLKAVRDSYLPQRERPRDHYRRAVEAGEAFAVTQGADRVTFTR